MIFFEAIKVSSEENLVTWQENEKDLKICKVLTLVLFKGNVLISLIIRTAATCHSTEKEDA